MDNPSGCIVMFFCAVMLVVLAMSCVGTVYLFKSEEVGGAIADIGNSVSIVLRQGGKAVLYIGGGIMGCLLLVGFGVGIKNAGPGLNAAGEGIAKAEIGHSVAKAIDEGRASNLPPVWAILGHSRLQEPQYESEYKLLEE
jgi:hypothetical protein